MKRVIIVLGAALAVLFLSPAAGRCAYHHEGEDDAPKFLAVYPAKAGTKLDNCNLCHTGGSYVSGSGRTVTLGSCQWCHDSTHGYGYDGSGDILNTLNAYGLAYRTAGSSQTAINTIKTVDSDGDGYTNDAEILAGTYPGDANDDPTKVAAPARVYTRGQLAAMTQHTQFMLMNTTKSGDSYETYSGVPMKNLLDDAGIDLANATGITVFSPDGFSMSHPLEYTAGVGSNYHVYGNDPGAVAGEQYPRATYRYNSQADVSLYPAPVGWCDYSSPGCVGRTDGGAITVVGGLKAILALRHDGTYLETGVLNTENKLDGEGPFRVVVPEKIPGPPDQASTSGNQDVFWPYNVNGDHNAGACSRTATIIKVLPLPEGTTDINTYEAGWAYVDSNKIVVYGAIADADANGNGILDSEENADGTTYYQDPASAYPRHAKGLEHVLIHTSAGELANVQVMTDEDPSISQDGKPSLDFPYGAFKFNVTGLDNGESVTVTFTFPEAVPSHAKYYKVSHSGTWTEIPYTMGANSRTILVTLTDGDPATDADGLTNGSILDPGMLGVPEEESSGGSSGGGCFITAASHPLWGSMMLGMLALLGLFLLVAGTRIRKIKN